MRTTRVVALALAGWMVAASALAADIKVLTAGAFKSVVVALAPEFERQTGHRLMIDNDTAGALSRRIAGGEHFDLVVLTESAIGQLARDGKEPFKNYCNIWIGSCRRAAALLVVAIARYVSFSRLASRRAFFRGPDCGAIRPARTAQMSH